MKPEHYRRTGRPGRPSEIVYVPTAKVCSGCQGRLARPHATSSYTRCDCDETEHYRWHCFDCGATTWDPPCPLGGRISRVVGGADYFTG